jgi:hypothetical protein
MAELKRSSLTISSNDAAVFGGVEVRNDFYDRSDVYNYLWSYYTNVAYDDLDHVWNRIRTRSRYYRYTRPIFNPTRRLVDLYAGVIWPGVLTADPEDMPSNTQLAVPLPKSVPLVMRKAMDQIWQWSNFAAQRYSLIRFGAALGNVLVEIIDDVDKGKVTFDIVHPSYLKELNLDQGSFVKSYTVEYKYEDRDDGKDYTYRRTVTPETISTFRDAEPYAYYGNPASYPNPYGFAPAVWVSHANIGSMFGLPAVRNVSKIDELNSLVSHANDQIHKVLGAPIILALHNPDAPMPDQKGGANGSTTVSETIAADPTRESIQYIEANVGAAVHSINLPEGQSLKHVEALLSEVERDHPELSLWHAMREMNQVSGIAVSRLFGDAQAYISEAAGSYDTALVRLMQMGIAIAGMRQSEGAGGWSDENYQRAKFSTFDLDSYRKGDLDFYIMPRPLVPLTEQEAAQLKILNAQAERLETEMKQPQQQPGADGESPVVNMSNGIYGRLARVGNAVSSKNAPQALSTSLQDEQNRRNGPTQENK